MLYRVCLATSKIRTLNISGAIFSTSTDISYAVLSVRIIIEYNSLLRY